MKTKSTFFALLVAATSFAFLTNCSGDKQSDETQTHQSQEGHGDDEHNTGSADVPEARAPQFEVDQKFQQQLGAVFTSYVELKEALVASDKAKVQSEAPDTEEALAEVDMKLLTGVAHNDWMAYLTPMQSSLDEIQSAQNLDTQRTAFSTLSNNLYKSAKAFGLGGKEAFYEFCPMAFKNEGAYWLSDDEKIRNPYFGDKMLTCGEVKEKIK